MPATDLVTGPVVPGAPVEPVLRIHEIQGIVLPGLGTAYQRLLGLRFAGGDGLRGWLGETAHRVTTLALTVELRNTRRAALRRGARRPPAGPMLGVALSEAALRLLTSDVDAMRDEAFRTPMYARTSLGDPAPPDAGSPPTWVVGGSAATTPHVLATVAADRSADLDRVAARLTQAAARWGATTTFDQTGHVLPGETEHFGFRDAVSVPGCRGRLSDLPQHFLVRRYVCPDDPAALLFGRPGRPLIWPGQFVFGYPGQDPTDPLPPRDPPRAFGPSWMVDGSYLVFRRLRQDVAAFRAGMAELAGRAGAGVTAERMAELLVGRRPDGSALQRDDGPGPGENHFGYAAAVPPVCVLDPATGATTTIPGAAADDPAVRCPAFAHIRKVNPRDLATDQGDLADTLSRLVLRRGITWGPPYEEDREADRGVLFLAYQTSITEQFEALATRWMNRFAGPEGRSGHDLLAGQHPGGRRAMLAVGGTTVELRTSGQWVVPTGGGYFFAPSVSALRRFARRP